MQKSTAATRHQFSYSDFAFDAEARTPGTTPRLIAMAASLVGDENKVKDRMRCSEAEFLLLCSGEKELTMPELEQLISLIVDEQGVLIAKQRELLAELRSRRAGSR